MGTVPATSDKERAVACTWLRLVRKYEGIQRVRLLFATTGQFLQRLVSPEARESARAAYSSEGRTAGKD
mgnify:CR=1 FL=1